MCVSRLNINSLPSSDGMLNFKNMIQKMANRTNVGTNVKLSLFKKIEFEINDS
jgi:hypothetical protein